MALNIQVSEDYRITSDSMNVIVKRKYIVDPTKSPNWANLEAKGASPAIREDWRDVSYHSTLAKALKSIAEQLVRDSDATDLAELITEIQRFQSHIDALVSPEGIRRGERQNA